MFEKTEQLLGELEGICRHVWGHERIEAYSKLTELYMRYEFMQLICEKLDDELLAEQVTKAIKELSI